MAEPAPSDDKSKENPAAPAEEKKKKKKKKKEEPKEESEQQNPNAEPKDTTDNPEEKKKKKKKKKEDPPPVEEPENEATKEKPEEEKKKKKKKKEEAPPSIDENKEAVKEQPVEEKKKKKKKKKEEPTEEPKEEPKPAPTDETQDGGPTEPPAEEKKKKKKKPKEKTATPNESTEAVEPQQKEEPKEEPDKPKDEPKDEPKEEPKAEPKDEPNEKPNEVPEPISKEEPKEKKEEEKTTEVVEPVKSEESTTEEKKKKKKKPKEKTPTPDVNQIESTEAVESQQKSNSEELNNDKEPEKEGNNADEKSKKEKTNKEENRKESQAEEVLTKPLINDTAESDTQVTNEVNNLKSQSNLDFDPNLILSADISGEESIEQALRGMEVDLNSGDMQYATTDDKVQKLLTIAKMLREINSGVELTSEDIIDQNVILEDLENKMGSVQKIFSSSQMIWKIDGFRKKYIASAKGENTILYSPAFLSHNNGYKMSLSLCPCGDGRALGTHMSIFFCIMKGSHDSLLPWPYRFPLQFILIDQSDNEQKEHITATFSPNPNKENLAFLGRPENFRNPSLGIPRFAEINEVWEKDYIKDDTIFIKVKIDTNEVPTL